MRYGMCVQGATSATAQASGITYSPQAGFKNGDKVWGDRSYVFSGVEGTPCAGGIYLLPNTYNAPDGTVISATLDWSGDTPLNELRFCAFFTDNNGGSHGGMPFSLSNAQRFTPSQVDGFQGSGLYGGRTWTHVFTDWMCTGWTVALPLVVNSGMDAAYIGKTIGRDMWTDIYANDMGAKLGLAIIDHNSDGFFQLAEGGDSAKCLSRKNKNDNDLYWLNLQNCDTNNAARAFALEADDAVQQPSVRLVNINTNGDGENFCLSPIGAGRLVLKRPSATDTVCAGFATVNTF